LWFGLRRNGQIPQSNAAQAQSATQVSTATPSTPVPATANATSTPTVLAVVPVDTPSPSPTAVPTDTPTLVPTDTVTPTATSSPTPLPTDTPTATETPLAATSTPTPTPTVPLTTEDLLARLRGKILFKTDRSGRVEIYKMEADGSGQEPLGTELTYLYNEAVRWEAFASDHKRAVVVRGEGQLDLWWVNVVEGGEGRITTDGAADYDAVWSPVDDRIVFVSERTGNSDLYLLDLKGSGERRLTFNEEDFDKHPSWSADATKLVFWSDRGWNKNSQIWLFDLQTEEAISLSNNPFRDWDPVWVK
jgi:dipeptidyl aminopeptidase/acylaminoacyl peptidase